MALLGAVWWYARRPAPDQYDIRSETSMNQLCTGFFRLRTFSRARSFSVIGESPGGAARHFCEPEYTASNPQASTSTGDPPSDVTVSTIVRQPWRWAISASVFASDSAPVDVSACTNATIFAS